MRERKRESRSELDNFIVEKKKVWILWMNSIFSFFKKWLYSRLSFLNLSTLKYLSFWLLSLLVWSTLLSNITSANSDSIFTIEWLNLNQEHISTNWWNNWWWNNNWWNSNQWTKDWTQQITQDLRTAIQKEIDKLWDKTSVSYVLDNNNDWKLDLVQITTDEFVVKEFNENLWIFQTKYEMWNLSRSNLKIVRLYKNWKLFHVSPINTMTHLQRYYNNKKLIVVDNWNVWNWLYYPAAEWLKYHYWIYNFKPTKQIIDRSTLDANQIFSSNLRKPIDLYFVEWLWWSENLKNFELYWSLPWWSTNYSTIESVDTKLLQARNEDTTTNYKLLKNWNEIFSVDNVHWLQIIWDFESHWKKDLLTFENYTNKQWIKSQKLKIYNYNWTEYEKVFETDSLYISWFSSWSKKYLQVKRLDWKVYLYKFNESSNTYEMSDDISWDEFEIFQVWDKKLISAKKFLSKSSWLWFVNLYELKNDWAIEKISEEWLSNWYVWYDFKILQNDEKSLWTNKWKIFWLRKWNEYKLYFRNTTSWKLEKVENWTDNQWILLWWVPNDWSEDKRFICVDNLCWTTKSENNQPEMFYHDSDWSLKRLKWKQHKLFSISDSLNQLTKDTNWNTNWWLECDDRTWTTTCNNYYKKEEFVKTYDLNTLVQHLGQATVLENWNIVLKWTWKEDIWNLIWSYYIYWNKNLLTDTWNVWVSYQNLSTHDWNNFSTMWKSYRTSWRDSWPAAVVFWFEPTWQNFSYVNYSRTFNCNWSYCREDAWYQINEFTEILTTMEWWFKWWQWSPYNENIKRPNHYAIALYCWFNENKQTLNPAYYEFWTHRERLTTKRTWIIKQNTTYDQILSTCNYQPNQLKLSWIKYKNF